MLSLIDRALVLLFPDTCPSCQAPSDRHETSPFCEACWSRMAPYAGPHCSVCGLPLPSAHAITCSDCMASPPDFRTLRTFGLYQGTLRTAVHLLKYEKLRRLAAPLADLLARLDIPPSDVVVPVPLHPARLREREFNQSALLARHLAARINLPVDLGGLQKIRNSPPQVGLSRKARLDNERGAFRAKPGHFAGRRVLLLDDVCTTGGTLRACASALMAAGEAREVNALTLARSSQDVWAADELGRSANDVVT